MPQLTPISVDVPSRANSALFRKATSAVEWSVLELGGRRVVQFVASIALARLLTPYDYGLVSMLLVFTALAEACVDGGLGPALVQRKNLTETDLSSALAFNVITGVIMTAAIWLCAPLIGRFYHNEALPGLCRVLAFPILITSCGNVQSALLVREMKFRNLAKVGAVATLIPSIVAVVVAARGGGVWSLAVQTITAATVSTVALWYFAAWRPKAPPTLAAFRELSRYGLPLLGTAIISQTADRLQFAVIGKVGTPESVGLFYRAFSLPQLPASTVAGISTRVSLPTLASAARQESGAAVAVRHAIVLTTGVSVPMLVAISALSAPLVVALFGARWLVCVPYLQVLSIAAIFGPLCDANTHYFTACGYPRSVFWLGCFKRAVGIAGLFFAIQFGLLAVSWSVLIAGAISYVAVAVCLGKRIPYSFASQLKDLFPTLAASAALWGTCLALRYGLRLDHWLLLGCSAVLGSAVYLAVHLVVFKAGLFSTALAQYFGDGHLANLIRPRFGVVVGTPGSKESESLASPAGKGKE